MEVRAMEVRAVEVRAVEVRATEVREVREVSDLELERLGDEGAEDTVELEGLVPARIERRAQRLERPLDLPPCWAMCEGRLGG